MFSIIAGLYPSAPKCQHDLSPKCDNQKYLRTWPSIPWREKLPSAENHWPTWFNLDYFPVSLPDPSSATLRYLFLLTWLFERMEHAPTSDSLQPLFSWPGMVVVLRAPWLYGSVPAFFWVSVQTSLNGEFFCYHPMLWLPGAFLVAQTVKNPPAVQQTWSLGWEDPLEKGMATHSSILAWRIQ